MQIDGLHVLLMSEPEIDRDDPDAESMFDFLADNRRTRSMAEAGERPLPIIRKPVPVSESGPLLPPEPGAPVEPPPPLTDGNRKEEDDFSFLDDPPVRRPVAVSPADLSVAGLDGRNSRQEAAPAQPGERSAAHLTQVVTNESPSPLASIQSSAADMPVQGNDDHTAPGSEATRLQPPGRPDSIADSMIDIDDIDLDSDDTLGFDQLWNEGLEPAQLPQQQSRSGRGRWLALGLAMLIVALGAVSLLLFDFPALPLQNDSGDVTASAATEENQLQTPPEAGPETSADAIATVPGYSSSPLMQSFREQLGRIEALVNDGRLDEAGHALATMDRTVYGYGAMEFSALEDKISQLRSRDTAGADADDTRPLEQQSRAAAERAAGEQAAREQKAQAAAERAAAEQAARERKAQAAAERAAAEQAAREREAQAAAERAAAEQAARREREAQAAAERAAAEQAAREREAQAAAEQAAAEQAARAEEIRRAEQAARAETLRQERVRLAAQAKADEVAAAAARTTDADRLATDRRIAEERAATQRQQARERRLIEAREREAAQAQSTVVPSTGAPSAPASEPATTSGPINDEDLQQVYRQFIDLQEAVRDRDINTVVALTQRSGVRVQQFMQMFENSSEIDVRIRNVSTRNATGEIHGTLHINSIRRADGSIVEPSKALSSIPLSSQREGGGWSAIIW